MDLKQLHQVKKDLPGGGMVLVLNTGSVIGPESEAMLQALHSRSVGGIREHLKTLEKVGSEKFMKTYYVGYGHKSIGDCATTTIFIEGVSMLVAKAIQDWPLYSGQESSTRYIDFAEQIFIDPVASQESQAILETWRDFYLRGVKEMKTVLQERFPMESGEEKVYQKAIAARTFDIMRGFLPAGASTNLAWHSNLRQIADKLMELRHHPLEEVRRVAAVVEEAVLEAFPNSFSDKRYPETETYLAEQMKDYYYQPEICPDFEMDGKAFRPERLIEYQSLLDSRPIKTELPRRIADCGKLEFNFLLDFGSFRDLQRHRAVNQQMPLLVDSFGFGSWYLSELSPTLKSEAKDLLSAQAKSLAQLDLSAPVAQYYIPMGYNVANQVIGDLRALVYLIELRATRFVHPTLRRVVFEMARELEGLGITLHLDQEPNRFDVNRGKHDIVKMED